MSQARDDILATIRRRNRAANTRERSEALAQRLAQPHRQLLPARALVPHEQQVALFVAMATEAAATVTEVASEADVAAAIATFLDAHGLPRRIRVAPGLASRHWPELEITAGAAGAEDAISVTQAFAAVAETGTLVLLSGPDSPTTLNFLPDTHIVLVSADDITGVYEDVWDRLRRRPQGMPRTINMITGPSRTGDIEQTIQLGAHGPRRLHIVIVHGPLAA